AALESLVELVGELGELPAEGVERLLLRLASDLRELAGRDRAIGAREHRVESAAARLEAPLDEAAEEMGRDGGRESPGGRPQCEAELERERIAPSDGTGTGTCGGRRGERRESRDQARDRSEHADPEEESGQRGQQAPPRTEGQERPILEHVEQPDR